MSCSYVPSKDNKRNSSFREPVSSDVGKADGSNSGIFPDEASPDPRKMAKGLRIRFSSLCARKSKPRSKLSFGSFLHCDFSSRHAGPVPAFSSPLKSSRSEHDAGKYSPTAVVPGSEPGTWYDVHRSRPGSSLREGIRPGRPSGAPGPSQASAGTPSELTLVGPVRCSWAARAGGAGEHRTAATTGAIRRVLEYYRDMLTLDTSVLLAEPGWAEAGRQGPRP